PEHFINFIHENEQDLLNLTHSSCVDAEDQRASWVGDSVAFGDVARVCIGAVTGDSRYYLLSEGERIEHRLPLADVRPVLTRARHVRVPFVDRAHWDRLRDEGERVWLFWPRNCPGRRPAAVAQYLRMGIEGGCHLRDKARTRSPWFRTRLSTRPD